MDIIVENTNNYTRQSRNELLPRARANDWYPTCRKELYFYFAIRIYITLHISNKISDYWNTSKNTPIHDFTNLMPRDRFQELYMRVRLVGMEAHGAYARVNKALLIFFFLNSNELLFFRSSLYPRISKTLI
jgi:hypothetical protein